MKVTLLSPYHFHFTKNWWIDISFQHQSVHPAVWKPEKPVAKSLGHLLKVTEHYLNELLSFIQGDLSHSLHNTPPSLQLFFRSRPRLVPRPSWSPLASSLLAEESKWKRKPRLWLLPPHPTPSSPLRGGLRNQPTSAKNTPWTLRTM